MPYRASAAPVPPSGLVVLDRYLDTITAELVRARLEGEGIRAFVAEALSTNPLWSFAGGGTTVSVAARDEELARAVLVQLRRENAAAEPSDDAVDVRCPRCESEYCFYERPRFAVSAKRWRCRKCDHVWDDDDEGRRTRLTVADGDLVPVFRLRRGSPGMGLFLGLIVGGLSAMALGGALALAAFVLAPLVGYALGSVLRSDVCSEPTCRAPLRSGLEACPGCAGVLAGIVTTAAAHHAAAADVRREMAAAASPARRKRKQRRELASFEGPPEDPAAPAKRGGDAF